MNFWDLKDPAARGLALLDEVWGRSSNKDLDRVGRSWYDSPMTKNRIIAGLIASTLLFAGAWIDGANNRTTPTCWEDMPCWDADTMGNGKGHIPTTDAEVCAHALGIAYSTEEGATERLTDFNKCLDNVGSTR
jgi:hypothetical protein